MIKVMLEVPTLPTALPHLPRGLIADLRREPTYALETIALAAVDVHGPAAKRWVESRRGLQYSPDQLARSAVARHQNTARVEGAALGFGGFLTAGPDVAALIWILTREVIFVAAAYGLDPTDKARAAEVLYICDVYKSVDDARAGLAHQGERLHMALGKSQASRVLGLQSNRTLGSRAARYASKRFAKRHGGRMIPGLGAVLGSIDNSATARRIGQQAITFYRSR